MKKLNITERRRNDVLILDLEGNIRLGEGCAELRKTLRFFMVKGERKIILNLAKVAHLDSSGLGELVAGFTNLQRNGGTLKLTNMTERVNELMIMTKLLTVFDVYENEAEALKNFTGVSVKAAYAGSLL